MAERALLVTERRDGGCALATSRWGGTDDALAAVCAGTDPGVLPGVSWSSDGRQPRFSSVVATLDFLSTEVLYRVRDGDTTVYLPVWFGLPLSDRVAAPTVGALVAVESLADARTLRRQFRRLKGALADAVSTGRLPASSPPLVLAAAIANLTDRERHLAVVPDAAERLSSGTEPADP